MANENKTGVITVDFEGVNFNASHWAKQTKEEFVKEGLKNGMYAEFDKPTQQALLSDAFKAIKDAVKDPLPEPATVSK